MRIRLINYKNMQLFLTIEKRYTSNKPIISLGCDCHPAYVLKALHLRESSFPFDWMNTQPSQGVQYVTHNVTTRFKYFLTSLKKNKREHVVSEKYPNAEFFHYPDLINNPNMQNTLVKRAERFLDFFTQKTCFFLFNITSEGLENSDNALLFLQSVREFQCLLKTGDSLLVYIRYDESFQENTANCEYVEKELQKLQHVRVAKYIRYKNKYGIWGSKKQYTQLLKSLGVTLNIRLPKVFISKGETHRSLLT